MIRLASDPPGTMGGEVNVMAGGGFTFWYTREYMPNT